MKITAPYGTWSSNITGNFVAEQSLRVGVPLLLDDTILWLESRPSEQGRQVIVMKTPDGLTQDILPLPWSARSKVHEYGGGAFTAAGNTVYFVNGHDQQIYCMDIEQRNPKALTNTANCRYADLQINPQQSKLVAVCEQHNDESDDHSEPENSIICIDLHNNTPTFEKTTIASGHDFFSNPRFSPCGKWLSYISWDHPNMPWDNTQLWLLDVDTVKKSIPKLISGNEESIVQPKWSPDGDLFWVSDKSNWWNIYCLSSTHLNDPDQAKCIHSADAEFATPQWVFGMSSYCFLNQDSIFATYTQNGQWYAIQLDKVNKQWQASNIESNLIHFSEVASGNNKAVFSGATATTPADLYIHSDGNIKPLNTQSPPKMDDQDTSIGRIIDFPTSDGNATAYGIFYPPQSSQYQAPSGNKPPLIVFGHGGPTGTCDTFFRYKIQYWTQRGFAILDVNYRGSTGYGRNFRHSLQKQWGIYDVEDLAAAAEYVTQLGWVHPQQRVVRGGSAGGFTVLAALTDTNTFNAGCTLYGVGDLETLATDTHKFEARYLDGLIGPYPEDKQLYVERSPIHKVSNISCPVMVFQGSEDKVVPPEQAETIVAAVKKQGLPVSYVLYKDEAHGFRQAKNIQHQAEAELYFYQQVLKLQTNQDDTSAPIEIMNWDK